MIIDIQYFNSNLDEINSNIYKNRKNLKYRGYFLRNFSVKNIEEKYNKWVINFPHHIIPSQKNIQLDYQALELNYLISEFSDGDINISHDKIEEIKKSRENQETDFDDVVFINDIIHDLIHGYVYNYNEIFNELKKCYIFHGIENEIVIIKNILILYQSVLKNPKVQINIFHSIYLTKELSDSIIKLLIEFFEHRLELLNPQINKLENNEVKITPQNSKKTKIKWLGQQQELAELFIELVEKGWIEDSEYQKRKSYCLSILELFDIDHTRKNKLSKPEISFYQKFKGEIINGNKIFSFIENKNYKRKFNNIEKN